MALAIDAVPADVARAVSDGDWLGVVNTYRAMSGVAPVVVNGEWSSQAEAHSCYMLQNGITHDEVPGSPGYTAGGDIAGNSGNVAVSSAVTASPRHHIDLWMTGPFHAIGILRPQLRTSGFGLCASSSSPTTWKSAATLDVLRGLDPSVPRPGAAITFPGNGSTVPLHSFITEFPNPLTICGWTGSAGLPLIAMMVADVTDASATLVGPSGPIETCVLHKGNVSDATARSILDGDNAVIVMPRAPLADGAYGVTVRSNGGDVEWTFNVNRSAPLSAAAPAPPPEPVDAIAATDAARFSPVPPFRFVDSRIGLNAARLTAGRVTRVQVTADPNVVAVSANFVSAEPSASGFITTYNCTSERPEVSTLGFGPGSVVANQAFVPLDGGALCLYSPTDTHVVIDVNGYYLRSGGSGFTPVEPTRLYDSRQDGRGRLTSGEERVLQVAGGSGTPVGATAVAVNLTAVEPASHGFVRMYPCGSPQAAEISSINFGPLEVRANTVVTPLSATGTVCMQSNVDVDVAVDLFGYFRSGSGYKFQPLSGVRRFDSRLPESALNGITGGMPVDGGQTIRLRIAGQQGVPAGARAVSLNITGVDVGAASYVTAFPCGERPDSSNLNITPFQGVTANGAMVKLSSQGDVCMYTPSSLHIIVDINGVWL